MLSRLKNGESMASVIKRYAEVESYE